MNDLTLDEAAERLGLTPDQLCARAGDGEIPSAILTADGWFFASGSIEALARSRSRHPHESKGDRP